MKQFGYLRPDSAAAAVAAVASAPAASYLAGGTNLVDLMKLGVAQPDWLVDVRTLLDRGVTPTEPGGVLIGAGTPNSDLAADPAVRQGYTAISQALLNGASGQLRNMASTAGNLLQRTRCVYFQDVSKPCNKRAPGSGCSAIEGEHHNLAVLGGSPDCIATHPSDLAVALSACDAVVHYLGEDGAGSVALDDLYDTGDPTTETVLPHGALITAVELPPLSMRATYRKVRERASYAFAIASVAVALDTADGMIRDVRIAFGAVAHKPWRARAAESALRGRPIELDTVRSAVASEFTNAHPLQDNAYKIELSTNIAVRSIAELAGIAL